ncbi:hypothetical protein C9374_007173 [Naegleria lovaniensis]|uniref:Uncharacterized protein n=1 Tax=Naegleria lovaniensis TaxID=51637 RepID=A0AA88H768_NAELO|nr:uncharacterized protein C9374_007173 [Naegleria lovaniensis]KAG2393642.1 hypothetical protein C9374_007173 [Naegleria lovaniensis]
MSLSYLATLKAIEQDFGNTQKQQRTTINDEYSNTDDDGYLASYAEKYRNNELLVDDVELDEAELEAYKNLMEAKALIEKRENSLSDDANASIGEMFLRDTKEIYDADAIKACMNKLPILTKNLDWIHTLQLNSYTPLKVDNPEDDIDRELQFYNQAITSAKDGFKRLHSLGIKVHRPDDYFAEMVKSDEHMAKIRNKLVQSRKVIEEREKRRQRKEQQKIGKQLKAERLKEKIARKKQDIEAVDHWRRTYSGSGKEFDVDAATEEYSKIVEKSEKKNKGGKNDATKRKNAGIVKKRPGKRKRQKQN